MLFQTVNMLIVFFFLRKPHNLNIKKQVDPKSLLICISVLLESLLEGISKVAQNHAVTEGGRCTRINLPGLLDSADKQNLLCQYIAQFRSGGGKRKKTTRTLAENIKPLD